MSRHRPWLVLPALALLLCACPPPDDGIDDNDGGHGIGTWPTPEMRSGIGDEACDNADNDGDGSIDEGCACTVERDCFVVVGNQCIPGTQACAGVWQECAPDSGGVPARAPRVSLAQVTPTTITQGAGDTVRVEVQVVTDCDAIVIPRVRLRLEAQNPNMAITVDARDDGIAPDTLSGDGVFTAEFNQPFGLGVTAQELSLHAVAELNDVLIEDAAMLNLVAP